MIYCFAFGLEYFSFCMIISWIWITLFMTGSSLDSFRCWMLRGSSLFLWPWRGTLLVFNERCSFVCAVLWSFSYFWWRLRHSTILYYNAYYIYVMYTKYFNNPSYVTPLLLGKLKLFVLIRLLCIINANKELGFVDRLICFSLLLINLVPLTLRCFMSFDR